MDKKIIKNWLLLLRKYWFDKDIENVTKLFQNTKFYQETPFLAPYTTYHEIVEEWQHIKSEDIKKIDFKILAVENYSVIVEWYLEQNNEIYEIKFNECNECIYFKSWEMSK